MPAIVRVNKFVFWFNNCPYTLRRIEKLTLAWFCKVCIRLLLAGDDFSQWFVGEKFLGALTTTSQCLQHH